LTISDLEDGDGDPLGYDDSGTPREIADIVFSEIGRTTTTATNREQLYFAGDNSSIVTRYRPSGAGAEEGGDGGAVNATFVGQGVDGPLGVIGTWTLNDSDVGRINDVGVPEDDTDVTIYGAFGAELP